MSWGTRSQRVLTSQLMIEIHPSSSPEEFRARLDDMHKIQRWIDSGEAGNDPLLAKHEALCRRIVAASLAPQWEDGKCMVCGGAEGVPHDNAACCARGREVGRREATPADVTVEELALLMQVASAASIVMDKGIGRAGGRLELGEALADLQALLRKKRNK